MVPFILIGPKIITCLILLFIYLYCVSEACGSVLVKLKMEYVEINVERISSCQSQLLKAPKMLSLISTKFMLEGTGNRSRDLKSYIMWSMQCGTCNLTWLNGSQQGQMDNHWVVVSLTSLMQEKKMFCFLLVFLFYNLIFPKSVDM